jgi:hypothetical protein
VTRGGLVGHSLTVRVWNAAAPVLIGILVLGTWPAAANFH